MDKLSNPSLAKNEVQRYNPQAPSSGNNPNLSDPLMTDDSLFDPVMKGDLKKVLELYRKHQSARTEKLTKSEQTALHIAISCNHQESKDKKFHLKKHIKELLDAIPDEESIAYDVLKSKDIDGNTPLHLAAALGNDQLCKKILDKCRKVSDIKNNDHETPLYMAVHHGRLKAYRCLHECDEKRTGKAEQEVWLGKDGNTILHSAIKGEYFSLAFEIIDDYKETVDRVNENGESPLHVLAKKPNFFFSSCQLRFYDSIVYHSVHVRKLKSKENEVEGPPSKPRFGSYPRNYRTCVDIVDKVICKIFDFIAKIFWNSRSCRNDGNRLHKDEEKQQDNLDEDDRYPPNYATCVLFLQTAVMFLLVIIGMGYQKIKKVREKKERHIWATQIMHKLLNLESKSYKYCNDGQAPLVTGLFGYDRPPENPPLGDDEQASLVTGLLGYRPPENPPPSDDEQDPVVTGLLGYIRNPPPGEDEQAPVVTGLLGYRQPKKPISKPISETPFLVAAKMGILEMVEAILKKFPVALYDLDANKKNALLLAIEHRQPRVFDFFTAQDFPDFVLHQVDDGGNSARHLSALFRNDNNPWRLPGSALQMHGEVTWFKHVKKSLPSLRFAHYNNEGETPRDIFKRTHEALSKEGTEWLIKTSESCSLVAALIATVAFATSATVPGGVKSDTGLPTLSHHALFTLFSIGSLCALCFSLTALVFFLAIITSRCQVWDFKKNLPRKLLMGLSSLFTSIAAILVSFCAGHFFVLTKNLRCAALPIYTVTSVPLTIFAMAQLPLYFDLLRAVVTQEPVRSYKVSYR